MTYPTIKIRREITSQPIPLAKIRVYIIDPITLKETLIESCSATVNNITIIKQSILFLQQYLSFMNGSDNVEFLVKVEGLELL